VSPATAPPTPEGVSGPIPRALFRLALPILASQALRLAYQWIDALWVRGLGVDATAAVTTSVFVMWCIYSVNDVVAYGVVAYVSQLLGAGQRSRAGVAALHGVRASLALGLVGTAIGIFGARTIYGWMGASPGVLEQGVRYLSVVLGGAPFILLVLTCQSILRAAGDSRTPFKIDAAAVSINTVLAPLLIYGPGPFPHLGVAGAAWATVIAQAGAASAYLIIALRGHRAFPLARRAPGPPVQLGPIARVGAPVAAIGLLFSAVYIAFSSSASRFGAASLAVVGIANRVEALSFLIAVAIGIAGATLVGQNLGAGRPERAEQVIRTALRWSLGVGAVVTTVFMLFPSLFIGLFTADPDVHRLGAPYLRILAGCLLFSAVEIAVGEAVLGSGHTLVISAIYTGTSLVRLPLAYWVPDWTGQGVLGIAWVISVTCAARALCIVGWTRRGTWKRGLKADLMAGAGGFTPPVQSG
jgi:putative MATE family efflux protein